MGGTSATAVAVDADGGLIALQNGHGANAFLAEGRTTLAPRIRVVLDGLRAAIRGRRAEQAVVGLAGSLARPEAAAELRSQVVDEGYAAECLVVNDAEALFASGTSRLDGCVLVAGTGAIAMVIRGGRVATTVDGHGWLLGDTGSAVWIGIAAVRAVLTSIDGRGEPTAMATDLPPILEQLSGQPCRLDAPSIVRATHAVPPAMLGQLARLVDDHAAHGDRVARRVLTEAVRGLLATLGSSVSHVGSSDDLAIVMGGSVVHESAVVRPALERSVHRRWPRAQIHVVRGGAAGAALWARRLSGRDYDDQQLERLRREIETFRLDLHKRN